MSFISRKRLFRARALMAYGLVMMVVGIAFLAVPAPVGLILIGAMIFTFGYLILKEEEPLIAKPLPGESSD
jgi:protein-S-isoprenylcysteine O-methyltransferase Ste14